MRAWCSSREGRRSRAGPSPPAVGATLQPASAGREGTGCTRADPEATLRSSNTPQGADASADDLLGPAPAHAASDAATPAPDVVPLEELLLPEHDAPDALPHRGPARVSPVPVRAATAGRPPDRRGSRIVATVATVAGALLLLAGGFLGWQRPGAVEAPARLEGVPPVVPDAPASGAAAPVANPAASAPAAPGGPAGSAAGAPAAARAAPGRDVTSREEPLYAGRPLAWWNDRLRALGAMGGEEALRLRATTLRRAAGLGLRVRPGDSGTTLEPAPEAP
jgi:hypothetical protein